MNKTIIIIIILMISFLFSGCVSPSKNQELEFVNVTKVIDGDTIVISSGEKVRFIGVNCPEIGDDYYSEAKQYTKKMLLNKTIGLERDISETDNYGRLLRYVWIDGKMINEELVLSGLALSRTYEPDTKYQSIFDNAQDAAQAGNNGIWSLISMPDELMKISYMEAGRYIGQYAIVEGKVVMTSKQDNIGAVFLNFHEPYEGYFTVVIWKDNWNKFPQSPDIMYEGENVLITGKIISYKGSPEIIVDHPSQITIV